MTFTPIYNGFKEPVINPEDYHFGGGQLEGEILREDGQWSAPENEKQSIGFETFNCTAFATTSCLEILFAHQYEQYQNFSDRFVGIISGTGRGGNSPHKVVEKIRHEGLVDEVALPFGGNNLDEYYSTPLGVQRLLNGDGEDFLKKYSIKHDWVLTKSNPTDKMARKRMMMEALRYSPLGVSVHAWIEGALYKNPAAYPDNHWTVCIGYVPGEYWIIFDSYAPHIKHLAWDFPFQFVKRYHVEKTPVRSNWLLDLLRRFGIIKRLK